MLMTGAVSGYDLPPINLGFTNFLDGGPPAGDGWYFSQYMQYWNNNELKNHKGGDLSIPIFGNGYNAPPTGMEDDLELDAMISLSQLIYQSKQEVAPGVRWGLDFILPTVKLDLHTGMSDFLQENDTGLGDLLVGTFLQWDPKMGPDGPKFVQRIEFQLIFPTGEYDDDYELNPGSNFFSFNPYWAGTYWWCPKWSTSWRVHYLWNAENSSPSKRLYPGAGDTQAGQAMHVNFSHEYEAIEKRLHVGMNGYFLEQFTKNEVDGEEIANSEERVFGIGPGCVYHFDKDTHLFANMFFESNAENRGEGERFNLRLVRHFK
jgi:hypothetical protein